MGSNFVIPRDIRYRNQDWPTAWVLMTPFHWLWAYLYPHRAWSTSISRAYITTTGLHGLIAPSGLKSVVHSICWHMRPIATIIWNNYNFRNIWQSRFHIFVWLRTSYAWAFWEIYFHFALRYFFLPSWRWSIPLQSLSCSRHGVQMPWYTERYPRPM